MIRSYFGLQRSPFDSESVTLLPQQQESFDILRVHAQQGGLCLVLGEPGTGKSMLKQALLNHDPKRMITPVVNRTLHTYHNTLRILCQAFQIEFEGHDHRCERLLVQEAFRIHRAGQMLVPVIDDAHLMPADCLRKLRLLVTVRRCRLTVMGAGVAGWPGETTIIANPNNPRPPHPQRERGDS